MKTTDTPQPDEQRVHIWDHPESRITFLETALANQEWRATIHPSALTPGHNLDEMARQLHAQGYHTEIGKDERQNPVLHILHVPSEAGLLESVKTLGLTEGIQHSLRDMSLEKIMRGAKKGVEYFTHDKAHLISAFYTLGDMILITSGMGNRAADGSHAKGFAGKLAELKKPENALQSLSGVGTLMTSLILMIYAKEGDSADFRCMKEQFYKTLIHGKNPTDIDHWETPDAPHSMVSALHRKLQDHGLGGAVTSQVSAMILQMASGGLRWKRAAGMDGLPGINEQVIRKDIRSSQLEIGRGIMSSLGWLSLLYPAHEVKDKVSWSNPKRLLQEYQGHPERVASGLTAASSILAMQAGRERDNFAQYAGEASLLLGDATMFFTDTKEYGDAISNTPEGMAKTAAKFIREAPALMDEAQTDAFVKRLSHYLAGRLAAKNPAYHPDATGVKLEAAMREHLASQPNRLNQVTDELAALVATLPRNQRSCAITALSDTLTAMPGVFVDKERLRHNMEQRIEATHPGAGSQQSMRDLAPHLAALVSHLPALAIGANAMRIYDTLSQFVPSSPRDMLYLNHALKQEIQNNTGLSPQDLSRIEQQAKSAKPQLH